MSHTKGKHTPYCLNCHYPTAEFDSFCPNCGQKNTDGKITLHDLVHEFVHSIFHLDGKLFTTLRHLFIPGKLTLEFFEGHHKRYAHPVQLFIVLCGLSIIFSGKSQKDLKNTLSKNSIVREYVEGKSLLFELDSIAKIRYAATPSVYDSVKKVLLEKNLTYRSTRNAKMSITEDVYREALIAIYVNTEDITYLKNYLRNSKDTTHHFRIKRSIDIHQQRLDFLKKDTAFLRQKLRSSPLQSDRDAEKLENMKTYEWGRSFGKTMAQKKLKKKSQLSELEEILIFSDTVQSQYITLPTEEKVKALRQKEAQTIKRDSTRLMFVGSDLDKIDDRDILNLSVPQIIEKYKIEGWLPKIMTKITYNFTKDVGGITFSFFGKKVYIYLVLMLPLAGFMYFLYRRQKRYYVEHIVFLMHYFCLTFLLEIPNLFLDTEVGWLAAAKYILEYLVILPIGIKTYYQQSWIKSFLKAILIVVMLYVMIITIFILGILISLAIV